MIPNTAELLERWVRFYGVPQELYTDWSTVYLRKATQRKRLAGAAARRTGFKREQSAFRGLLLRVRSLSGIGTAANTPERLSLPCSGRCRVGPAEPAPVGLRGTSGQRCAQRVEP